MRFLFAVLLLICCSDLSAQTDTLKNKEIIVVEEPAEFPGGVEALYKFIGKNLRYPASARRNGIEGKSMIRFVIEPDGSITNVKSIKPFNEDCDNEAIRVVKLLPKWKPGKQSGRNIRQYQTLPITFKLSKK